MGETAARRHQNSSRRRLKNWQQTIITIIVLMIILCESSKVKGVFFRSIFLTSESNHNGSLDALHPAGFQESADCKWIDFFSPNQPILFQLICSARIATATTTTKRPPFSSAASFQMCPQALSFSLSVSSKRRRNGDNLFAVDQSIRCVRVLFVDSAARGMSTGRGKTPSTPAAARRV